MRNRLAAGLLFSLFSLCGLLAQLSTDDTKNLDKMFFAQTNMTALNFPRVIVFPDKEMENYLKCKAYFEESYAALKKTHPDIDSAPLTFRSRSVPKMVKDIRALIEKNEQGLRKERDLHNEDHLSEEDVYHLEQIARVHRTLTVIEFPRPITATDRPLEAYANGKASFEKSLRALKKKFPKVETWTRAYKGETVGEMIADIKSVIEKNERGAATRPNPEAMKTLEFALGLGNAGAQMVKPPKIPEGDVALIRQKYDDYVQARDKAIALDPRALTYRKQDLEFCEKNFAQPARQLLENKQREQEKRARERVDIPPAEKMAKDDTIAGGRDQLRLQTAHTIDYIGIITSIEGALRVLQEGTQIEVVQSYLIQREPSSDDYVVLNTTGDYAIYINRKTGHLIAVVRQDGANYLQGTALRGAYFATVEVKEFKRVSGGNIHLPVFADKSDAFKSAARP